MKVLHLIDTTGPGGAQKVLSGILDCFGSGHHAIALRQGRQNVFSEGHQIKVCRTSSAYSIKPFFSVFSYVRKHKPLVLHCHLPKSQLLGILVCKILKKPPLLILHEQGDILDSPRLMKVIYRYFASEVKLIVACSGYLKKKIAGLRPEFEPITRVIPNFVDNSFFLNSQHYKPVEEKNLPFNIGFAGRLVRRKGWQSLVSFIHSSQHDFHFWIAGDGPDKKRLLKELKKNTHSAEKPVYTFMDYVSDMQSYFQKLDCLVILSLWEGFPLILLEALASKVPVIILKNDSNMEIIGLEDAVLFVDAANTQDLNNAVKIIQENGERRKNMISRGYNFALDFQKEIICDKLRKSYLEIAE